MVVNDQPQICLSMMGCVGKTRIQEILQLGKPWFPLSMPGYGIFRYLTGTVSAGTFLFLQRLSHVKTLKPMEKE
jgi:hypothetical protein